MSDSDGWSTPHILMRLDELERLKNELIERGRGVPSQDNNKRILHIESLIVLNKTILSSLTGVHYNPYQ